tara:strand:+ start:55 stop:252 length:198 start_codon:yes stop_codon:yes gene_type:complete
MNNKELTQILNTESKDNKIGFILSSRKDKRLKTNKEYYQYVFDEYQLMDIDDINTQFSFYIKQSI